MSSFDSMTRIPSSLRCFSSQSVSTSASGCAHSVGCVLIGRKFAATLAGEQGISGSVEGASLESTLNANRITRISDAVFDHSLDIRRVRAVSYTHLTLPTSDLV